MGPSLLAYGMNKFCAAAFLAAGLLVSSMPLLASSDSFVASHIESMVIHAKEAGWRFTLELDDKHSLQKVVAEWEGKKLELTSKDFGEVPRAFIEDYSLSVERSFNSGKQDSIILTLPYNETWFRDPKDPKGGKEYSVFCAIRLHFNKGKLAFWERMEAIEDKPEEWKLTSKGYVERAVVDGVNRVDANGIYHGNGRKGKENPFLR